MMKRALFASAAIAAMALSFAARPVSAEEMKAEVIHWWTSGGEAAAVKVFADQFTKAGGTWVDSAVAGAANARNAAISRTVAGNPPTAMQLNTGKQFDELVEGDLLADVDAIATEGNWKSVMPAAIIAAATRKGKMYAVPINIHGQNWLWYNKAVLASVGAAEPKTWNDAIAILDKLKADGKVIPLAFSGQKNWEQNLFNSVMIGVGGGQMWTGILGKRDAALAQSAEFKQVAVTYKKLKDYVDAGAPGRNWNDATNMVIQGKAGMQIMGDWAKGEFVAAGKVPEKDYGCTVLSNGGGGYVMDGYGGLHPFSVNGGQMPSPVPTVNYQNYWPGWDIARGIVSWTASGSGNGGWVLDGWGGVHQFGNAPAISPYAYWPGWDIATSLAGNTSNSGSRRRT